MSGRPDEVYWFGVVDVKTVSICDGVMTGVQAAVRGWQVVLSSRVGENC